MRMLRGTFWPAAVAVSIWSAPLSAQAPPAASRPNVVLIITDDVGYGDIGSYGAPDIKTPNIDSLARDGVRLTDFYANGPTARPTRAGLITGRYQQRFALEAPLRRRRHRRRSTGLPRDRPLAAAAAEEQRLRHGAHRQVAPRLQAGVQPQRARLRLLLRLQERLHRLLPAHRRRRAARPVRERDAGRGRRLHDRSDHRAVGRGSSSRTPRGRSSSRSPTTPRTGRTSRRISRRWRRTTRATCMPHDDGHEHARRLRGDARARRSRRRRDPADARPARASRATRIVIFTNDNGGEWLSRNAPLFHRKGTLWEGGIRVPAIVRWPGRIPAGQVSPQVGITMDLTASILAATGRDGAGRRAARRHRTSSRCSKGRAPEVERTLFWRTNAGDRNQRAVRSGDWKLLLDGDHVLLFNLRTDLGERNDVANDGRTSRAGCSRCYGVGSRRGRRGPGQRHCSDQSRTWCRPRGRPVARWPRPSRPRHGSRIGDAP